MPNAFQITYISQKQFAIRYLTPNFGTPIRYRYQVSLFGRAGTVTSQSGIYRDQHISKLSSCRFTYETNNHQFDQSIIMSQVHDSVDGIIVGT